MNAGAKELGSQVERPTKLRYAKSLSGGQSAALLARGAARDR